MSRGLTLIETLAAIVLLSLMAVGVVPMLREAGPRRTDEASPPEAVSRLSEMADRVVQDPRLPEGIGGVPPIGKVNEFSPEGWNGEPILIEREQNVPLAPAVVSRPIDSPAPNDQDRVMLARLRFSTGDTSVVRWVPIRDRSR